jgi:hypothetical protein
MGRRKKIVDFGLDLKKLQIPNTEPGETRSMDHA